MNYTKILEVARHPLGLVGVVLFFVFGALSKKKTHMPPWWSVAAICLAAAALFGGLFLTYYQNIWHKINHHKLDIADKKEYIEKTVHAEGDGATANVNVTVGGSYAPVITVNKAGSNSSEKLLDKETR